MDLGKYHKKIIIIFILFLIIFCSLIGVYVYSLSSGQNNKESDDTTKILGLLNNVTDNKFPVVMYSDILEDIESRDEMSDYIKNNYKEDVARYLAYGDFNGLDAYLSNIQSTYKDASDGSLTLDDIDDMRADISMINLMNSDNGPSMFQSFRNPEILVSAIIYSPISCKYKAFKNGDSLMLPAADLGLQMYATERIIFDETKDEVLEKMNMNTEYTFDGVKVFTYSQYDVMFEIILAHNLITDTWAVYDVQSPDDIAYLVFNTALVYQNLVLNGQMSEDTLDNGIFYTNFKDIDLDSYKQQIMSSNKVVAKKPINIKYKDLTDSENKN